MEYSYLTRADFRKSYANKKNKHNAIKRALLPPLQGAFTDSFMDGAGYSSNYGKAQNALYSRYYQKLKTAKSMSAFLKAELSPLVNYCVPKQYVESFYAQADRFVNFQYTSGYHRRSLRTEDLSQHFNDVLSVLYKYYYFGIFGCSICDYIKDKMSEEALDFKRHGIAIYDDIIAAEINAGNTQVIEAIKEGLLSDNNNVFISVEIIRAIFKSENRELWDLLGKFLLAARLQEGVRQAICENMDCGYPKAFLTLLKVIEENNLIRFASVKRASATWTGICSEENADRISEKLLSSIILALSDPKEPDRMMETEDSMLIYTGLWAKGFYSEHAATDALLRLCSGTRHQLLTASYYLMHVQNARLASSTAYKVLCANPGDMELAAAYMPSYRKKFDNCQQEFFDGNIYNTETRTIKKPELKHFFDSREEASEHYRLMQELYNAIPKKELIYSPCIFPWHSAKISKSDLVFCMAATAHVLRDPDLIDEQCGKLSELSSKSMFMDLFLTEPKTETQKRTLVTCVADRAEYARKKAFELLKKQSLSDGDILMLESFMKYKYADMRRNILELLSSNGNAYAESSIKRMLASGVENVRLGGMELLRIMADKDSKHKDKWTNLAKGETAASDKEEIFLSEISGGESKAILEKEGFGLYSKDALHAPKRRKADLSKVKAFFVLTTKELDSYFDKMTEFLEAHANVEYTDFSGEKQLLGNRLAPCRAGENTVSIYRGSCYPLADLWDEMYKTIVKTPDIFWNLYIAANSSHPDVDNYAGYSLTAKNVFGDCTDYIKKPRRYLGAGENYSIQWEFRTILSIFKNQQKLRFPADLGYEIALYAADLPEMSKWFPPKTHSYSKLDVAITSLAPFISVFSDIAMCAEKSEEEFKAAFSALLVLEDGFDYYRHWQEQIEKQKLRYYGRDSHGRLSLNHYVKALSFGIISEDEVLYAAFEVVGLSNGLKDLSRYVKEKLTPAEKYDCMGLISLNKDESAADPNARDTVTGKAIYNKIIDMVLDVELKRGDTPTVFSGAIHSIDTVYGMNRLFQILKALGSDTLDRNTYYSWYYGYSSGGTGRKECLSHLLKCCVPLPTDTSDMFAEGVKKLKLSSARLAEVAMYSPAWVDLIEEYLGCPGFKSGCYYFMAHMNERFDDKKAAMIAKYTPLSESELNDGCFDTKWFFETYEKLGDKTFMLLYKAAKYIADGNKHSRARKYADSALGKLTRDELETIIKDKRNKDYLMSYGLLPIENDDDILHRYSFLQQFLKESKQFGALRRASESKCVAVALKNLATTAGFEDDMRLILAMETALVTSNAEYFKGMDIDGYSCRIKTDIQGKAALEIKKDGKVLKSVPAAIKKNESFLEIQTFNKKLRDQYSRCVKMFEASMENSDLYSAKELKTLCSNPVTSAILGSLVFFDDSRADNSTEAFVMFTDDRSSFADINGEVKALADDTKLRIAHPYDMYKAKCWDKYQQLFLEREQQGLPKQAFRQVFRELYVKLDEELESTHSMLFAGNQIQAAKTVSTLRNRKWVADYDTGLQKVSYVHNIIAEIYALADWFSPADIEPPTLEYVEFCNRKNFEPIPIKDVPDILYSETMRDVDLAVSVAHAGGVDPEASHSTIEMRKVIMDFNIKMFKLDNVRLEGTHAFIKGKLGDYTVQLGSGAIHQSAGPQINVLPVHSQTRGKIFLPFVEDDPKTSEILSKILLFARDDKIKDPYILGQIVRK